MQTGGRFSSRAMPPRDFERDGALVRIEPTGPLLVSPGTASDLAVAAPVAARAPKRTQPSPSSSVKRDQVK
jgi:hypothetical protein